MYLGLLELNKSSNGISEETELLEVENLSMPSNNNKPTMISNPLIERAPG
jgi:hypothetical protein